MIMFTPLDKCVGALPQFFDERDPKPAMKQIDEAYGFGGGWHEMEGFTVSEVDGYFVLSYPQDPDMVELSRAAFRNQWVVLFPHSWVMIIDRGNHDAFSVARID